MKTDRTSKVNETRVEHTSPSLVLDLETLGVRPCLLVLDEHLQIFSREAHEYTSVINDTNLSGGRNFHLSSYIQKPDGSSTLGW